MNWNYEEQDHIATPVEAMHEYARNVGYYERFKGSAWILTDYDVWVPNPHYDGPPQRHPEDDMYDPEPIDPVEACNAALDEARATALDDVRRALEAPVARNITVRYRAVDGFRKTRKFKTLAGARKFAQRYVGASPELGSSYAVSSDGVGTVRVEGCTLRELFQKEDR